MNAVVEHVPRAILPTSISEYAIVGDGRSAALISRDGSVDWLCWPRFDSASVFAAVLDAERGGHLRVAPAGPFRAARRYVDDTNVLETTFTTPTGVLRVVDFMPLADDGAAGALAPEHELLRIATCEAGEVDVDVAAVLRPRYGEAIPMPRDAETLGVRVEDGPHLMTLRATCRLVVGERGAIRGRAHLRAGEELQVSLAFDEEAPAALPPLGDRAWKALRSTVRTWRSIVSGVPREMPYRDAVVRSALALKLLVFAPSGAIIAAPTTSLPERPGGPLNWDYRYCWLRDASLVVRALHAIGCRDDAVRFASWMLHATRLTRPELRVLYDVFGNVPPRERELPHLSGHGGARPVRVGNAAAEQVQLDVYGEVIDAVAQVVRAGSALDGETQSMLRAFGAWVCEHWERPDSGIWEPREPPAHRTHSLVLAWAALARLLELHRGGAVARLPVDRFERNLRQLRERVEREGWSEGAGSYTGTLGGSEVDAALLLLPWYGYTRAADPRMRATWCQIRARLTAGPGLLYRYERSIVDGEGAFGICSFWAAEYLARGGGTLAEARAWLERALAYANDVGLFGEEIDPGTGLALGNFPQAFTHVGVITAALAVRDRASGERALAEGPRDAGEPRA